MTEKSLKNDGDAIDFTCFWSHSFEKNFHAISFKKRCTKHFSIYTIEQIYLVSFENMADHQYYHDKRPNCYF